MRIRVRRVVIAALALCVALPAFALERKDVPEKLKWNLADIFPNDAAWTKSKTDLQARIKKLNQYQGKLGSSALNFYTALQTIFDIGRDLRRLELYATLGRDQDQRVGTARERAQVASQMDVDYASAISWVRPEILALGATKVKGFEAQEKRLAPYHQYLDDILRYAPHTLSAAEEKVASEAGLMEGTPNQAYDTFVSADLPYPTCTLSTGEKVRLDAQAYTKYRASTNRADRDLVFKTFWGRYKEFERTLGATLDGLAKTHLFDMRVHKYKSTLEAAAFGDNIPTTVYTRMIADVHASLPTLHRYLKLRKRMMGVDQLRYEDLYAPIVKSVDMKFTPEQAQELVLKAVAPLGPDYVATMRKGYESRWVDFPSTTGKHSGAYSDGAYGVHPYELLNFNGDYEGVTTLAHEWGHTMHTYLADQAQPYPTHSYATFIAEVASTLNENLLLHHMLDQTRDKQTRLYLLGNYLDGLRTTLFRQTMFAEFELKFHQMAEKDEPITGEKLSQMYLALVRQYYGDAQGVCKVDSLYGIEWAYIPHFYYDYYVYQYATSITASSNIAANMRAEQATHDGTKARDAYMHMLQSGSSKYPVELLREAGVDMTTSKPFQSAMAEMNSIMDEMEKLLR
jgi:oligoendopeptidase F